MEILVDRVLRDEGITLSKVSVDGKSFGFGLEDAVRLAKIKGETAIPAGRYRVGLRYSPKFSPLYKHDMLWVQDVPGFEYILIHPGNTAADTEGCLLVGSRLGVVKGMIAITNSVAAYRVLYAKVVDAAKSGQLWITYRD